MTSSARSSTGGAAHFRLAAPAHADSCSMATQLTPCCEPRRTRCRPLVVGGRGTSGPTHVHFGSVAQKLTQYTTVPLAIVSNGDATPLQHVVLGVDGSDASAAAAAFVAEFAGGLGVGVTAVHAFERFIESVPDSDPRSARPTRRKSPCAIGSHRSSTPASTLRSMSRETSTRFRPSLVRSRLTRARSALSAPMCSRRSLACASAAFLFGSSITPACRSSSFRADKPDGVAAFLECLRRHCTTRPGRTVAGGYRAASPEPCPIDENRDVVFDAALAREADLVVDLLTQHASRRRLTRLRAHGPRPGAATAGR